MSTKRIQRAAINFFPVLKDRINQILSDDTADYYAENPVIDIGLVAEKIGIHSIQYVSPDVIQAKHPNARAYIDTEQGVIFVSNADNPQKQRFSIAHEIFHSLFALINDDGSTLKIVTRMGEAWKTQNAGSSEAVGEDIADYFAANLLVPTERFALWEDKTDEEIAKAFGVEPKCIKIRREEVEHELNTMIPEDLSASVKIDDYAPLSFNELTDTLGGNNSHAHGTT